MPASQRRSQAEARMWTSRDNRKIATMFHVVNEPAPDSASLSSAAMSQSGRILVVEEDLDARRSIMSYLADRKCAAVGCSEREVSRYVQSQTLSLITLNARLGRSDGLDILSQIRSRSHVPVIMYSEGPLVDRDRIIGLELGADDFLCAPLNLAELLARAHAILRRQELGRLVMPSLRGGYRFNGWELRHSTRELKSPATEVVSLTKREYALLRALLKSPGIPLSRVHLMRATRTYEDIHDRSIDVQVLRLRRVLERHPSGRNLIKTERGFGYALDASVETLCGSGSWPSFIA